MLVYSMYVDNEYTAKQLEKAAKRFGFRMMYQWVRKGSKLVVACDFFKI